MANTIKDDAGNSEVRSMTVRMTVEELFAALDTDGSGGISPEELQVGYHKFRGHNLTIEQARELIRLADLDGNSEIDLAELVALAKRFESDGAASGSESGDTGGGGAEKTLDRWLGLAAIPHGTKYDHLRTGPSDEFSKVLKTLTAGGVAGAVARTIVAPLERLKIIFQTQVGGAGSAKKYTSIPQALRLIVREEGFRGLFRGNGANVVRIAPASAIQFYAFEVFRDALEVRLGTDKLSAEELLVAGGAAGAVALVATYPLDMIRARLTVQVGEYRGIVDGLRTVAAQEGARALYKGIVPSLAGVIPYVGIDFMAFSWLSREWAAHTGRKINRVEKLAIGALAGVAGQTVAYPLDLVRRRLQLKDVGNRYGGRMTTAFQTIVREEGVAGLYRGIAANYLKAVPAVATSFLLYAEISALLGNDKSGHD